MAGNKYKIIAGIGRQTNDQLEAEAKQGWVPILFTSTAPPPVPQGTAPGQIAYAVILELQAAQ